MNEWIIVLLRIGLIAAFTSLVAWIGVYTWLAPWWRNPIGRTLVAKTSLIALLLIPSILSIFFNLNRFTSTVAAWFDVALINLIAPVMVWRIVVWLRLHRMRKLPEHVD